MSFNLHNIIGADPKTILWWQMCIRAILIFLSALLMVRISAKRIYGKYGSLDIVIAVILGSILSRALTANAQFLPTLAAAFTLIFLHLLLVKIALRNEKIDYLLKGKKIQLIGNGKVLRDNLQKADITLHDLQEAMRAKGIQNEQDVRLAYLERSGDISIIKAVPDTGDDSSCESGS